MNWILLFQLFLFDFDGLLVDTEPLHFAAYQELCRSYGFELNWSFEQYCQAAHFNFQGIKDALYAEFPALQEKEPRWDVLYKQKKQIYAAMLKEGRLSLMPGAAELLEALHRCGIRHCVVTNSPREQIEIIKEALPALQKIPLWLTREDYDRSKPAPDGYLKAIALLGQEADRIIGFEDSLKGIRSLLEAHVEGVLICSKDHPQIGECSSLKVAHFESLSSVDLSP